MAIQDPRGYWERWVLQLYRDIADMVDQAVVRTFGKTLNGGKIAGSGITGQVAPGSLAAGYIVAGEVPTTAVNAATLANPSVAPTLVAQAGTTSLLAGVYTGAFAWVTPLGETGISPTATVTITAGQQVQFTMPAAPAGVIAMDLFLSVAAGSAVLGSVGQFTQSPAIVTALPAAAGTPAANTTGGVTVTWTTPAPPGMTNPMTTRGDIIVENATPAPARLALGAIHLALMSNGTDLVYLDPISNAALRYEPTCDTTGSTLVDVSGNPVMALAPNGALLTGVMG